MTKVTQTKPPKQDGSFQGLQSILEINRPLLLRALLRLTNCRAGSQLGEHHRDEIYFLVEALICAKQETHLAELSISKARGCLLALVALVASDEDSSYLLTDDEDIRSAINLLNELLTKAEEIKSTFDKTITQR